MHHTAINRRLEKVIEQWRAVQDEVDLHSARTLKEAGASADLPIEQWPPDVLAALRQMHWPPEQAMASLQKARAHEQVIEIHWVKNWRDLPEPPLLVIGEGLLDALLPTGEAESTPAAAQGENIPELEPEPPSAPERHPEPGQPTAQPQESWEVRKERYKREMQEQQRRERRSGHSLAAIHRRQREEQQKRR